MGMEETKNYVKGMLETYLRKKGIDTRKNFRCLNPDHDDRHPSMSFHGNIVHCFSCGATYDIFSLVGIDYHISDFRKQFEIACQICGVVAPSAHMASASVTQAFSASVSATQAFSASRASQGYARCNCNAKTKLKSANSSFKGTVEASRSVVGNKTGENFQWLSESQKNGSSAMSGLTVVPRAFTPAEAVNGSNVTLAPSSEAVNVSSFKLAMEYLRSRGITNVTNVTNVTLDPITQAESASKIALAHGSEAPVNGSNVTLAVNGSNVTLAVNGSNVTLAVNGSNVTLGFGKVYGRPAIIIPTGGESYFARFIDDCTGRNKCVKHGEAKIFNLGALQTGKVVFVVEGEFDALSVLQAGGTAVALGSVSNKNRLLDYLRTKNIKPYLLLALDNDDAGRVASHHLLEELAEMGINAEEINISGKYKDPNEALVNSPEEFHAIVNNPYARLHSAKHRLGDFMNGIAESVNTPAISTGFPRLDEFLNGGLYEGLYILGAISSAGKTAFVLQMADEIAKGGGDVLYFSLEMSMNELMARSVSRHTLKKGSRLAKTAIGITAGQRYEKYSDAEKRVISESINDYGEYADHIFIHEGIGDIGVKNIKSSVEKHLLFTGRRPVIFIDYLQMLAPHNDRYTDKQNMDKAVLELKRISREFKVPVVVISSLNRSSYSQCAKMEAFKESGAIEYSADVLLGLQYKGAGGDGFDINDAKSRDPREIEIKILKNRNGKTGDSVGFRYYAMFNYFEPA